MKFHRNLYNEHIRNIIIISDEIENEPKKHFKAEDIRKSIENVLHHLPLCEAIKNLKDFLLFKKIFENAQELRKRQC